MIIIDGSIGGGQILRSSLSLSVLTQKPFKIINIRKKRSNSGLQRQHLTAVNSIAEICKAKVKGNELDSTELEFIPSKVNSGNYKFDIGTAGSTTLVLETILPPLIFAINEPSNISIIGGTANPLAPPALDIREVFLWHLKNLGIDINLEIEKEGFYPKGGGIIKAKIVSCKELKEIKLQEPNHGQHYEETNVIAVCSKELKEKEVAKRMIKGFKLNFPIKENIKNEEIYTNTLSPGCYLHASYCYNGCKLGMSVLGEKTKKSEDIGKECALKLKEEMKSGENVDSFTADQLLIYMAIKGSGEIRVSKITDHTITNIQTIEKFLDVKFKIKDNIIECTK
ncbi:RNA 3'-phosphate cyclase [Candidatus Woesearchaeota archaeon]|nr:RNA 3'-phosphate cyclase [Candidatus Woesearchaeota archaeon]